jgi:hypothetical protein
MPSTRLPSCPVAFAGIENRPSRSRAHRRPGNRLGAPMLRFNQILCDVPHSVSEPHGIKLHNLVRERLRARKAIDQFGQVRTRTHLRIPLQELLHSRQNHAVIVTVKGKHAVDDARRGVLSADPPITRRTVGKVTVQCVRQGLRVSLPHHLRRYCRRAGVARRTMMEKKAKRIDAGDMTERTPAQAGVSGGRSEISFLVLPLPSPPGHGTRPWHRDKPRCSPDSTAGAVHPRCRAP